MPTIPQIIRIAKISQYLCANEIGGGGLYGAGIDLKLPRKLYLVRKNVEWMYGVNPTDDTLIQTSNFLYGLCGKYIFAANNITGSGGSISPVSPANPTIFPLVITGADFEVDGVTYNNPDIVGLNLMIFVSGFNSEWQFAPTFFNYTPTGITIVFPGFDANNYSTIIIQKYTT